MKVSWLDVEGPSDRRMDLIPSEGAVIGNVEVLAEGSAVAEKPDERHREVDGPSQRPGGRAVASDENRLSSHHAAEASHRVADLNRKPSPSRN